MLPPPPSRCRPRRGQCSSRLRAAVASAADDAAAAVVELLSSAARPAPLPPPHCCRRSGAVVGAVLSVGASALLCQRTADVVLLLCQRAAPPMRHLCWRAAASALLCQQVALGALLCFRGAASASVRLRWPPFGCAYLRSAASACFVGFCAAVARSRARVLRPVRRSTGRYPSRPRSIVKSYKT